MTTTHHTGTAPRPLALLRAGATALVAALALLGAVLAASPASAAAAGLAAADAADDAPWTVRAAPGELGPDRSDFEYAVNPGDRVDDGVVVTNTGAEPLTLDVYAADAVTAADGAFQLGTRADAATGVGRWLSAGATSVELAPGEARTVPLTLTVPDDVAPGELWGGVVVSRTTEVDGTPTERRVALRVHVRVSGAVTPALVVEDVHVGYAGGFRGSGAATVTFTVHNTGTVALAGEPSASVSGPFGAFRSAEATAAATPLLLPGETWPVTVEVPAVTASGLLTATASVVPLLTDPAGSTAGLPAVESAAHAWAVPWVPLLAVVVVLGFVGALFAPRRKLPGSVPDDEPAPAAAEGAAPVA